MIQLRWGRWGGYTLKHVLWRSCLGLLPRTVLVAATHPSVYQPACEVLRNH